VLYFILFLYYILHYILLFFLYQTVILQKKEGSMNIYEYILYIIIYVYIYI